MKGQVKILPGFYAADKEIEALFYGGDLEPQTDASAPIAKPPSK